jgi:hypothetical protein
MATQQYDVKSQHMNASGLAVPFRTRMKGYNLFANSATAAQAYFYDTSSVPATYTRTTTVVTVTYENHGLYANQWVYLDFTSGGALDGLYQVTGVTANTFTVTTAASGSIATSNVTAYMNVLLIIDTNSINGASLFIPGEGILARGGIQVVLAANQSCTVFYG